MAFPLAAVGAVTGGINALSGLFGKKSGGGAAAPDCSAGGAQGSSSTGLADLAM